MGATKKILILEDDPLTNSEICEFLSHEGYTTEGCISFSEFSSRFDQFDPDLIILDKNLGDSDGVIIAKQLTARSDVAIIMISGAHDVVDIIVGLEMGADDYLAKPFQPRELLARCRALLRRKTRTSTTEDKVAILKFGTFKISQALRVVYDEDDNEVLLTTSEFEVLSALVSNAMQPLSRMQLMDRLKNSRNWTNDDRAIDGFIAKLRKKLGNKSIKTIHNIGYMFALPVSQD